MNQWRAYPRYTAIVGAVALAAALTMVFFVFRKQTLVENLGDPYGYAQIARGFVDHGFVKLTRRAASLYPELIAVVYRLGGSNSTVLLIQVLFHVGTSLLAFNIGARVFNARTGLLAGLACALHPMLLRYVGDLQMEPMLAFLSTATVLCAIRFSERPSLGRGVALASVGMVGALTKGVILPFLGIFAAIYFVKALRARDLRRAFNAVAIVVVMALWLAPWTYRNYRVTGGQFVPLTPGSSDSFLRGYVFTRSEFATLRLPPYTYAENECNAWFRRIASEAGTVWERDEVVDEKNNAKVVKHMIVTHPLDTARKVFVGMFTFWYEMTSLRNSLIPFSMALVSFALAYVGYRRAKREGQPAWLLLLPIVVMNVFVALLIPLGRYSVPILPCLMVLAAFGVDTLLLKFRPAQSAS